MAVVRPCLGCGALTTNGSRCAGCATFQARRGIGGWEWAAIRLQVRRRDGNRCVHCGAGSPLEVHHVVPLAEGGGNEPENLVTLCRRCHRADHGRSSL